MARKKKQEEHDHHINHDRWLISYADFVTLLFAFFVVMYALSSVNEGKYRVLSDALISAFHTTPQSLKPTQIGEPAKAPKPLVQPNETLSPQLPAIILQRLNKEPSQSAPIEGTRDRQNLSHIQNKLQNALASLVKRDLISVKGTGRGLEVEINASILFDSGETLIQPKAVQPLREIAAAIKDFPNAIIVEGFTDNVPIRTSVFPSNWELSAGRAASVVHLFTEEGVDPFRQAAIGYGEYRPVATNDNEEGRRRNRRVVVVILSEAAERLYNLDNIVEVMPEDNHVTDIDLGLSANPDE
jgi:chemotaxis protein MotB